MKARSVLRAATGVRLATAGSNSFTVSSQLPFAAASPVSWRRGYELPKRNLTPHEKLVKWYEFYECNNGYHVDADRIAAIFRLASEVNDPKWTTRQRVESLVSRANNGTVYSYNSIVSFLHSHGWIDEAFTIFELMKTEGVEPNVISFTSLINCYFARNDTQNAALVLEDARKAGLAPSVLIYATLFKGLAERQMVAAVKMYLPGARADGIDSQFVSEIEALAQQNNSAAIVQKCTAAIHHELSREEAASHKEEAELK